MEYMPLLEGTDILLEASGAKSTNAVKTKVYPMIEKALSSNISKYRKVVSETIEKRQKELFEIAPMNNIIFTEYDNQNFYKALGIDPKDITKGLSEAYFYPMANFNPRSAKDEFTAMQMCVIRYFILNNKDRDLELAIAILMISGKFYPSAFGMSFPTVNPGEYREIMVYAVNNELSNKFDLKVSGSLFASIRNLGNTCFGSYKDMMKNFSDEDYVYVVQQAQTRLRSFMKNIASVYYDCYENRNYLTFDSDNYDQDNFRLADNDSLKIERCVERTMKYVNSNKVDYAICKSCSSDRVSTEEVKTIIEFALNNRDNIKEVRELIQLMISCYMAQSKDKDINNIAFIAYSISPKPNAKDKNTLRQKEIVTKFLRESPSSFNKRRNSPATEGAYYRAVYMYFARIIFESNK